MREAPAALKASRPESSGEITLEELLAIVKGSGASAAEKASEPLENIDSINQLGEALSGDGIERFERSLGLDETETPCRGSRVWRNPGRLVRGRERLS